MAASLPHAPGLGLGWHNATLLHFSCHAYGFPFFAASSQQKGYYAIV